MAHQKPSRFSPVRRLQTMRTGLWHVRKTLAEAWDSLLNYEADALVIRGREKHGGEDLRLLYVGTRDNLDLLLRRIYADFQITEKGEGLNSLSADRWVGRHRGEVDLVVVDVNWPYCNLISRRDFLSLPPWLDMSLELGGDWEVIQSGFRKHVRTSDLRIVRKLGLSCETVNTDRTLREFYHSMYVPYVKGRFGEGALVDPEQVVVGSRSRRHGQLMRIVRDGVVVAAGLVIRANGRLSCAWLGMPDGLDDEMRKGAMNALYYFNIRYAFERGCRTVDFFGCRPFLDDGAFRFKRKWGASAKARRRADGRLMLQIVSRAPGVRSFLANNPLISSQGRKLVGRILLDPSKTGVEEVRRALAFGDTDGLESLEIYALGGFDDSLQDFTPHSRTPVRLIDLSSSPDPLLEYCSS